MGPTQITPHTSCEIGRLGEQLGMHLAELALLSPYMAPIMTMGSKELSLLVSSGQPLKTGERKQPPGSKL